MLKLANQVIDIYDDTQKTGIKKIAKLNPGVYVMTPDERNNLDDTDFALSVITKKASKLNKFPVDTKDNTWLSNQYFEMNHDKLPKTAAHIAAYNIKVACERFKVEPLPAVVGLAKEATSNLYYESEPLTKTASVKEVSLEKIAQVQDIGDNYTHAQYAMPSPSHVKMAGKYFDEKLDKIPMEYRHKYAAAIQRRARELGMPVQGGTVAKYASDHYSGMVDAHIQSRATLLEVADPAHKDSLQKLAAAKKSVSPSEFAQALFAFDKKAGLSRYYGSYLKNPFEATFASEPDQYAGYRTKVAGTSINSDDLRKLAIEKYAKIKDYFGASLADEFKRDPTPIFESLPMDSKEIFVGIANGTI